MVQAWKAIEARAERRKIWGPFDRPESSELVLSEFQSCAGVVQRRRAEGQGVACICWLLFLHATSFATFSYSRFDETIRVFFNFKVYKRNMFFFFCEYFFIRVY